MTRAAVVQYRTRADCADHNQWVAEQMCHELNALDPDGVHFQVFRLQDGVGFVHVAVFDGTGPVRTLTGFRGLPRRYHQPPGAIDDSDARRSYRRISPLDDRVR